MMKHTGFTLIELAIVLAILGLGVGGGLTLLASQDERSRIERTSLILDGVEEALESFYAVNGRLPCPADRSLAINAAGFGVEWSDVGGTDEACDQQGAQPTDNTQIRRIYDSTAAADEEIWIGTIPTRTLGLADRFAFDGWESKLVYAVPRALANQSDASGYRTYVDGRVIGTDDADIGKDIIIVDSEGEFAGSPAYDNPNIEINRLNPFGDSVSYVLVSHGAERAGGFTNRGGNTAITACNEATQDGLNCQSAINSGVNDVEYATFRDQRINDGDITANYYYDYIRWKTLSNFTYEVSGGGNGTTAPEHCIFSDFNSACPSGYTTDHGMAGFIFNYSGSSGSPGTCPFTVGGTLNQTPTDFAYCHPRLCCP